jgi:hypothetical protein
MNKNYGSIFSFTNGIFITGAVAALILLFGVGAFVMMVKAVTRVPSGIPVWAIAVIGIIIILFLRRKRNLGTIY